MGKMIPTKVFFTKGVGRHREKLESFELALRDAGIEYCNHVRVSSIFPPKAKIISVKEGRKLLQPGQITFCVLARNESNEKGKTISSSVGLALPKKTSDFGYLSECEATGDSEEVAGACAEEIAASMLATRMGFTLDPQKSWGEQKKKFMSNIKKTMHTTQAATVKTDREWTTVIAVAVLLP